MAHPNNVWSLVSSLTGEARNSRTSVTMAVMLATLAVGFDRSAICDHLGWSSTNRRVDGVMSRMKDRGIVTEGVILDSYRWSTETGEVTFILDAMVVQGELNRGTKLADGEYSYSKIDE